MENKVLTLRKMRWLLRLMGCFKIPMLAFVKPRLLILDQKQAVVEVKLRRRTKNHLNSMYFGALAVGADVAAGLPVFYFAQQDGLRFSFSFASMKAEFHKRAESSVRFVCTEMDSIRNLVHSSKKDQERKHAEVTVLAYDHSGELVATFVMGLSVKVQS